MGGRHGKVTCAEAAGRSSAAIRVSSSRKQLLLLWWGGDRGVSEVSDPLGYFCCSIGRFFSGSVRLILSAISSFKRMDEYFL